MDKLRLKIAAYSLLADKINDVEDRIKYVVENLPIEELGLEPSRYLAKVVLEEAWEHASLVPNLQLKGDVKRLSLL